MQTLIRQAKRAYPKMVCTLCVNLKNKVYPPECYTKMKFKENSQQFTLQCSVNHRKYGTSQSNDVAAVWDRKISHGCLTWAKTISHW
jgi:hypothetical protein